MTVWRRNSKKVKDRLLGVLGICAKAGKLTFGFDAVREAAVAGQISLILLTGDLSPKSAKEMTYTADKQNINICAIPVMMDEIAFRFGKRSGIIGITDKGLADAVQLAVNRAALLEEETSL
jgi:ribosomal protein L7Ae-like RNA K-turn-binding protein